MRAVLLPLCVVPVVCSFCEAVLDLGRQRGYDNKSTVTPVYAIVKIGSAATLTPCFIAQNDLTPAIDEPIALLLPSR